MISQRGRVAVEWKTLLCMIALGSVPALAFAQAPEVGTDAGSPPPPSAAESPPQPTEAEPALPAEPVPPPPMAAAPEPEPEPEPEPAAEGSEMVVTAQRYEQDAQKAPVTVTAFGQRAMDQRGVSNLQDVGKFTPNLELHATNRPAGGGSAYAAYIRGIGTGDFQFPSDPGVGLYIDDVYIARTVGGLLSTDADIARIEVVKGPQGTLYGRNTIGGAFNISTSKPLLEGAPTGSGLVRFGIYGRHDFAFNVNAPVVSDVVGAKISLSTQHMDGYGHRLLDGQYTNDEDRFTARAGLLFKLSQKLEVRVDGDYSQQNQNPPNGTFLGFDPGAAKDKIDRYNQFAAPALNSGLNLPAGAIYDQRWLSPSRFDNYALQPVHDRYHMGGGSLKIDYAATEWLAIKSITAARVLNSSIRVDGDQTPYPLQSSATELDDTQLSEELQFSGRVWNERLQYLVGLYAFHESGKSTVDTQSFHGLFEAQPMPNPMDASDTFARFGMKATSLAVFTQETMEIVSGLHVTLGARFNHDKKDYDYGLDNTEMSMATVPQSHAEASWNSFTPKAAVDYSPVEPVLVYAGVSQGFKSGGFGPSNSALIPTPKYNPERVTAYELGLKTHWFAGRKLIANLAGFYNDYRDIQLTVQSRDPIKGYNVRTTENAGTSFIKGVEAELIAAPVRGLSVNVGFGYVDARFHDLTMAAEMSKFKKGGQLPQIPAFSLNAGIQYAFDVSLGELTLRADASVKGTQYLTAADDSSRQGPYALYSARISFVPHALDALEVSVYGLNLSDTTYYVYLATLAPTGQKLGLAGPPRTIFATARYMF